MKEFPVKFKTIEPGSEEDYQEPFAVATYGLHGSGKTRLGCSMPGDIGVIALERKTKQTALKTATEFGRRLIWPEQDFTAPDVNHRLSLSTMNIEQAKAYYRKRVNSIKETGYRMLDQKNIKSIMLDGGSELFDDVLCAEFGRSQRIMPRDRGPCNKEMREFLSIMASKHLIITHQAKEIWANDKPTGKYDWAGYPHIGYNVNVLIEQYRDNKTGEFRASVVMCQANPSLHGSDGKDILTDEALTFSNLAMMVYPESEIEEWE